MEIFIKILVGIGFNLLTECIREVIIFLILKFKLNK